MSRHPWVVGFVLVSSILVCGVGLAQRGGRGDVRTWSETVTHEDGSTTTVEGRSDRSFDDSPRPDGTSWEETRTTERAGKLEKKQTTRIEQSPYEGEIKTTTTQEFDDLVDDGGVMETNTEEEVKEGKSKTRRITRKVRRDGKVVTTNFDEDRWVWENGAWKRTYASRSVRKYEDERETESTLSILDPKTGEWSKTRREYPRPGGRDAPVEEPAVEPLTDAGRQAPVRPAGGSVILTPGVGFGGGTLTGVVVGPDSDPVEGVPVQLTTTGGFVVDTRTDAAGQFEVGIPPEAEGPLTASLTGVAVGAAVATMMALVDAQPEGVADEPPYFMQVGSVVDIAGDYPRVVLENSDLAEPIEVPTARSVGPAGELAVTRILVPFGSPAQLTLSMTDAAGTVRRFEVGTYEMTGSLDQDKLRSGQKTEFTYELQFPPGPARVVWITVSVTGAVRYARSGKRQPLRIEEDGSAVFVGNVQAKKGTATGIPFEINAVVKPR